MSPDDAYINFEFLLEMGWPIVSALDGTPGFHQWRPSFAAYFPQSFLETRHLTPYYAIQRLQMEWKLEVKAKVDLLQKRQESS